MAEALGGSQRCLSDSGTGVGDDSADGRGFWGLAKLLVRFGYWRRRGLCQWPRLRGARQVACVIRVLASATTPPMAEASGARKVACVRAL
jgi:hypothetical protein